jgi:hypothetical protein
MFLQVANVVFFIVTAWVERKRPDTVEVTGLLTVLMYDLLHRFHELVESLGLVHGQICEDFTIEFDVLQLEFVDELGISDPVFADCGVDTYDPEAAVFALLQLTTNVGVSKTFFNDVFRDGIDILAFAVVSFGLVEDAFPAGAGGYCVYGTRHVR